MSTAVPLPATDRRDNRPCLSVDPEVFFPSGWADRETRTASARAMCRACFAVRECAAEALRSGITHGVVATIDLGDEDHPALGRRKRERLRAIAEGGELRPHQRA
ncbi:WhiB family transcriptional regulator [Nocardia terpenica]|uniref:4Fe-4S Wbl-type domain-containing protein n=1 Tax=Nocardia terpenica TaxID=455432 RepID=A0A164JLY0_9NOCA|nr:WhiB family transcriptional regulator [Nocardia terpenica]KZM70529.1 hypothetical protein AWN90_38740 [Nocardia terpenica]NQE90233.1 WhiB family transcriptional regulator [Nocardia terpenica]